MFRCELEEGEREEEDEEEGKFSDSVTLSCSDKLALAVSVLSVVARTIGNFSVRKASSLVKQTSSYYLMGLQLYYTLNTAVRSIHMSKLHGLVESVNV